ncbi:flagellar basal body P-ring protein FlgI [Pelagibius sp.]|uniref:flagellar basal body P-ring protein FlgI n=1 Tax=Pelagibius sp. TaxID=1931238 RepID=UPI00262CBA44|nr:flagellar basal body P-ring protein FlgI [Pelagibius sp.]
MTCAQPLSQPARPRGALAAAGASLVLLLWVLACLLLGSGTAAAQAQSRIKDLADFEGVRDNLLVGYGLVVGLNGTGDDLASAVFTRESLIGMLQRLGVNARDDDLDSDNVAAVMVTANLPPFSRQGTRIDIQVSALGDADSLLGGTLLVTPLLAADGEVYAVAQGQVAVAGFSAAGNAETIVKGVPTSGRIANGAIIERELGFELEQMRSVKLSLRNPDLTTARRVAEAINAFTGENAARSTDPATVRVSVPARYNNDTVALMTDIEQLRVRADQPARVVIDEASGIIVMGENVRISTVAIAQGNLTIRITETPQVSQPNAFSATGDTEVVDRTQIEVDEDADNRLAVVPAGVSLQELVNGLNALGIGPRDMISILQAIKAAGALQAEIEVL